MECDDCSCIAGSSNIMIATDQLTDVDSNSLVPLLSRFKDTLGHGRIFTMGSPMLDRAESLAAEILEAQCVSNEDIDLWETCWPCWQASNFHQFSNSADLRAALHHLKNTEGTCE